MKTHNVIVGIDTYDYQPRLLRFFVGVPEPPQADIDKSVIVLNVVNDYDMPIRILNTAGQPADLRTRHVGNILLVYISNGIKTMKIPGPPNGYQLKDRERIFGPIDISFRIDDLQNFWKPKADPVDRFETKAYQKIQEFFSSLNSVDIIPVGSKPMQSQSSTMYSVDIGTIELRLKTELQFVGVQGIAVENVHVATMKVRVDRFCTWFSVCSRELQHKFSNLFSSRKP